MILKRLVVGPFGTNCYVVGAETAKEGMIIDPGSNGKQIIKEARESELNIKLIVVTHAHIDHIGALREVKETTGAPVAIHADEAQSLSRQGVLGVILTRSLSGAPSPDRLLRDGDRIEIGELSFLVLHTPGHSPGGVSLYGHGALFSGDTLFNYGIGRYDLAGGSYSQIMNSINARLMALPDDTRVYPGHGPETTIGAERRGNPFLRG